MLPLSMVGRIVEESVTKCYLCVETRPSESALAGAKDMFLIHRSLGTNVLALLGLALLASPAAFVQANDPTGIDASAGGLEFPRVLTSEAGVVVVHAPQIDTWRDFARVDGRAAVEVRLAGEDEVVYGVAEFSADTDPNLELRVVAVENLEVTVTSFPVADAARRERLDAAVRGTAQRRTQYVPLDVILSYIAPDATVAEAQGLSFDPPPIFFSSRPAVLVMTDGEMLLAPVPDTRLQFVVNTNWDLFRYKDKEWYLRLEDRWLKSRELNGDWAFDSRLPGDFKDLPDDGNWSEVEAAIPPAKGEAVVPTVFVSDRPAELIVTDGAPSYRTVGGPGLEYVTDTESDLFRYEGRFYYLVSGRWFGATELRGPWEHVEELPDVFAMIPEEHEKGHVLAAVPGTEEARLAVLEAMLPRKATVSRDAGEKVNVFFQGEPVVERAVNSYNDILKVDNVYYLCDNAVWYQASSTDGPWVVATSIPAVIYSIPPSSPSYHVTHVHVYDSDDDSVSTGYTSGYFGVSVAFGIAMYGSGWYYPPYYGYYPYYGYPYYPVYYPYPYSYGASAWYNPNTGMYGRSASVYGPYGGYGRAASYNPRTGTYARGEAVWDSNEIAGRGVAYNPRTGTGIATNRYANEKGGWGESLVTHNDKWLQTQSEWDKNSRRTDITTSEGGQGVVRREGSGDDATRAGIARGGDGDIYAGKDGSVYRRDENGWSKRGEDGWSPVEVPDERAAQIDQARSSLSGKREELAQARPGERPSRSDVQAAAASRGFADSLGSGRASDAWSNRTYDSTRNRSSFDGSRRNELNRSHSARTNGYQRYNNRSASAGFNRPQGSRSLPRRRR